jgi:phosphate transport system substrate-binding protein
MSGEELAKAKGTVLQLPVDLGGVAISYNIPRVRGDLKMSGQILARIFGGTLTNWDAPAIAKATGVNDLPNLPIVAVHRADSSGPGWDFDRYLIETAPSWVAAIGTSKASTTWPLPTIGVGQQLNSGVATYIKQTPGAIGYVEYGYALQAGFTNVALENTAGKFVTPSESSIAKAGTHAADLSWKHYSIINQPGAGTYPLANFSWALLYQRQPNEAKGIVLGKVLDYVVAAGQNEAGQLGFAPMPANAVNLATSTLEKLANSSGRPLFSK